MPQLDPLFLVLVAVVVAVHWALPGAARPAVLASGGAALLLWVDPVALAVALVCTGLARLGARTGRAVAVVALFVAAFVGVKLAAQDARTHVVVPVGLGFLTLRLIHYLLEQGRGQLPPHGVGALLAWALFPPVLLVGPIDRFDDFARDAGRKRWDPSLFAQGLDRVLIGYAKVVVLAGWFARDELPEVLAVMTPPGSAARVGAECVHYGLQLYLTFAGYSDIAIGWGLLLGHRLPENFNAPFLARDLAEFWRSWHATLGAWCRDYVFAPVAAWTRRPTLAILAAMLTLGLWHEATWRYVAWGAFHGLGLAALRAWQRWRGERPTSRLGVVPGWAATMTFVLLSFIITKNATLEGAARDAATLLGLRHAP